MTYYVENDIDKAVPLLEELLQLIDADHSDLNQQDEYRIHIATHGYYDLSEESDSIYSSCLLLAGVVDWLRTDQQSDTYGNGIITADEISRMNYHNFELVVLSSCLSAMNDATHPKGFQGIVSCFEIETANKIVI